MQTPNDIFQTQLYNWQYINTERRRRSVEENPARVPSNPASRVAKPRVMPDFGPSDQESASKQAYGVWNL